MGNGLCTQKNFEQPCAPKTLRFAARVVTVDRLGNGQNGSNGKDAAWAALKSYVSESSSIGGPAPNEIPVGVGKTDQTLIVLQSSAVPSRSVLIP